MSTTIERTLMHVCRCLFTALTVLPSVPPCGGAARMPEQLEDEGATVHPAQLKVEEEATVHPAPHNDELR